MKCPVCENSFNESEIKNYLPFCSKRCRLIDLGDWLSENYSIKDNESNFSVYENNNHDE